MDFEPSGIIQTVQTIEAAEVAWSEITGSGWDVCHRSIAITSTDIVVADTLTHERQQFRSIISFYPRFAVEDISYQTLQLDGCQVLRMQPLRDCHVVLFCQVYNIVELLEESDPELDDVNGHWFAESTQLIYAAIILHVPTRIEIQRVILTESPPFAFSTAGGTVSVGLAWKGVIMTGTDVRDLGENYGLDGNSALKLRRKKNIKSNRKRNPKGFSKQDGYARGMSMQG
jgi:hypothetical protein